MSPLIASIIVAVGVMLTLAVVMGWILGWANVAFYVETDPRIVKIAEILPGANCGACGFAGCNEYATQLVEGSAEPGACTQCNKEASALISSILGVATPESFPYKAVVHCRANETQRLNRQKYVGEPTCAAANLVSGIQGCTYGCLGFGDCVAVCPQNAIQVLDGLASVRYHLCIGCRKCESACPRGIISIIPFKKSRVLAVVCSNKDFGPDVKAVCRVGCIGCGACSRKAEAFGMEQFLPVIDYARLENDVDERTLLDKCPAKSLLYIGEPTEEEKEAVRDESLPEVVRPQGGSTVDDTKWRN
ncbi:MAG: RnfABCDGE type electron transport complex subunit B [Planctomycetia bacterium]|nr:RnfABCDGE type electron transport complex subunit B [Planctomycetia bacterium]